MTYIHKIGKNKKYTEYGVIGKSGKFYPCPFQCHIETKLKFKNDAPFIDAYIGHYPPVVLHDFGKPSRKQFEVVMDMCTEIGEKFEDVVIGTAWDDFLG